MFVASRTVERSKRFSVCQGFSLWTGIGLIAAALLSSSGALAQCKNTGFNFGGGSFDFTNGVFRNLIPTPSPLISIMNTVNTAFLTNATAFVSAPPGPGPNQQGGGVWGRAIVGTVDSDSQSSSVVRPGFALGGPFGDATGIQDCDQSTRQEYAGVQVGADLATLNLGNSGGNLHFGITAGSFYAKAKDTTPAGGDYPSQPGDVRSTFDVPFIGVYTAYIQGNFFADAQVRWDFYQSTSSSRIFDYSGVQNDARGIALTGSLGYRIPLISGWFIEPSIGGSWSRVKVDSVTLIDSAAPFAGDGGIVRIEDIDSILGRASLRIGTSFVQGVYTWQPFVSASVIHEFAGKVDSSTTLVQPGSNLNGLVFDVSTERFGSYAQFGLGTAVVVGNTGWLGYGRVDYRTGDNIEGLGFNGGLRYHW